LQVIYTPHPDPVVASPLYKCSFLKPSVTPLFVPAIDGVAVGRILSIGLDGNNAVWLELLALNAFESEENCIGYVQNPGTLIP